MYHPAKVEFKSVGLAGALITEPEVVTTGLIADPLPVLKVMVAEIGSAPAEVFERIGKNAVLAKKIKSARDRFIGVLVLIVDLLNICH